ncbi:MAG: hypothetical protein ACFB51_19600 [Anaerolineae bacterium]
MAWAGTAAARVISFIIDRPGLTATYLGLLAFEIAMGVFMLV